MKREPASGWREVSLGLAHAEEDFGACGAAGLLSCHRFRSAFTYFYCPSHVLRWFLSGGKRLRDWWRLARASSLRWSQRWAVAATCVGVFDCSWCSMWATMRRRAWGTVIAGVVFFPAAFPRLRTTPPRVTAIGGGASRATCGLVSRRVRLRFSHVENILQYGALL